MISLKSPHIARMTNMLLRLTTLVAKLALTLYMGKFLSLSDMGTYGLAFGTVMISTTLIGFCLDYVVSREIVGSDQRTVTIKMRDQAAFYAVNYIFILALSIVLIASHIIVLDMHIATLIIILAIVESVANMTYNNLTSLGHPLLANLLFFIRSGAWAIIVAIVGYFIPSLRTADAVLAAWIFGSALSVIVTLWAWRDLPWRGLSSIPVDWPWIINGVKDCAFIWLGVLGIMVGAYTDRFVIAADLDLDLAGVVTFYSSFAVATITLIHSGVLAFAYPRLILLHREKNLEGFRQEAWKTGWHVALIAGGIAIGIGIVVPLIGRFFDRPILVSEAPTLWLMLLGMWLGANSQTFYYILFARHQDRAVWLGGLLYLIPSLGGNAVLVPIFGFIGIGYASVLSNLFLALWRYWYVRAGNRAEAVV